jgi:hypothetical protein
MESDEIIRLNKKIVRQQKAFASLIWLAALIFLTVGFICGIVMSAGTSHNFY